MMMIILAQYFCIAGHFLLVISPFKWYVIDLSSPFFSAPQALIITTPYPEAPRVRPPRRTATSEAQWTPSISIPFPPAHLTKPHEISSFLDGLLYKVCRWWLPYMVCEGCFYKISDDCLIRYVVVAS